MSDDHVYCGLCRLPMSLIDDWQVVPRLELAFAAKWNVDFMNGWYWCAECNEWTHLPTVNYIKENLIDKITL